MGAQPGAYVMGSAVNEENAKKFGEIWGFEPPAWKGLSAAHMVLAAERGEMDALWQTGGNFKQTLPEPELVKRALGNLKLRIHQDIVVNPTMLVDPADTVVLLPSRTRYEQRGGGTETSTERRIIYSPEIPGPRVPETKDEWEIPVLVARALHGNRAGTLASRGKIHRTFAMKLIGCVRPIRGFPDCKRKATTSNMVEQPCWWIGALRRMVKGISAWSNFRKSICLPDAFCCRRGGGSSSTALSMRRRILLPGQVVMMF